MSVGTDINPEKAPSPSSFAAPVKGRQPEGDNATTEPGANSTSSTEHASPDAKTDTDSSSESKKSDSAQINSTSSLLASLWSPISSLLQSSTLPSNSTPNTDPSNKTPSTPSPTIKEPEVEKEPEPKPYYTPSEVPLFKTLQKTRLSGTRTKQLLRAASRGYNDPPQPPELGSCCGSSCDPCVNDLWREERDVWRGRWGDRAVENSGEDKDKDEGGEEGEGGRKKVKKELEW